MKERPILFSAPMIRAILNGTKTQTRRVAKLTANGHVKEPGGHRRWHTADFDARLACPYGQPGDRLWVRETWAHDDEDNALFYRADVGQGGDADDWERNRLDGAPRYRWRPSIHMPRTASRITLEITSVRVERLQDISRGDAMAEGCPFPNMAKGDDPRQWFRGLWESINGPESWQADPLVWVVEFKRLEGGAA